MPHIRLLTSVSALLAALLLLSACSESQDSKSMVQQAAAIENSDECHLCGMIINNHPGPKGELYQRGQTGIHKFCSTRDMFAYLLDPERQHQIESVFVHNMAVTPWDHPDDEVFIDARQAWFVAGSSRQGAMGPTLASFADQADAKAFADEYGGTLYQFEQISLELLSQMGL